MEIDIKELKGKCSCGKSIISKYAICGSKSAQSKDCRAL
jgi:hypothetical protein